MGGIGLQAYVGHLPEAVLKVLPPTWRAVQTRLWPTAKGDLLFLILDEQNWGGGHGYANVVRIPASALKPGDTPYYAGTAATPSNVPAGAPANAWYDNLGSGSNWVNSALVQDLLMEFLPPTWQPGYVSPYEGQIITGDQSPQAYKVENGRKRWIYNPSFFTENGGTSGYSVRQVIRLPQATVDAIPTGLIIFPPPVIATAAPRLMGV
jgi:hypothetical protein